MRWFREVLGAQARAEPWLVEPAKALERRRSLDVLTELGGAQRVQDVLTGMLYGVY